ncbi:MAG: ABC transporter permease subunit [Planctomycetaceae bacterium]|nr:ABC transporter permease subunit [Planctomycetaceae bacterium]
MFKAVLRRELVTPLRRPQMLLIQIGLATVFGVLIAARWPSDGQVAMLGSRSQQIFRLFSYGLLGMLLLLLPVFPATSIVSEKKSGTLALLFNTPLGAGRIFAAKLLAVLALAGMIIAMSLPAAGACFSMGGLSLYNEIGKVYLLLILVSLQYAAVGLLVSSFSQSVDAAIRITYGIVLGTSILTLGPHYFFQGTGGRLAEVGNWLRCLSPLAALISLTGVGDLGGQGLSTKMNVMGGFTLWSLACTTVVSLWTISRLNHRIFDHSRAAGTMSDDLSTSNQVLRRLVFLVDPQKRTRGIPSFLNPVMVKEFRSRKFGRLHWLMRLVAVCALLSLGLTYATTAGTFDWGVETIGGIMVVMQVALIVLIAPSLSAGILSVEREHGAWQLLMTTPLSMTRIIWGKLFSAIVPLMLVLCATMPGYLIMAYIEPGMRLQVNRVIICLALTAVFAMSVSAAVGCFFRRSAAAMATAYAVLLAICGLPLLFWMGRDAPFGHDLVETALTFSSIAAAFSVIEMSGFENYNLVPANWWFLSIASVASLIMLPIWTYRISRPQ